MIAKSNTHDLKTLLLSFHPVIVVETVEEGRVKDLLWEVGQELSIPVWEWSLSQGLNRRPGVAPVDDAQLPSDLLEFLMRFRGEGIFHLKDFAVHLEKPVVARRFRDVAQRFALGRSALVLTGDTIALPREIEHKATFYELRLPSRVELREVLESVVDSVKLRHRVRVDLLPKELDNLLAALSGLTLTQARQTIAYCLLEDGRLDAADISNVLAKKAQIIREGSLLEYFPAADNRFELGGFARLKEWLERARVGFSREARAIGLDPPKGILVVGVQGCGKSLSAKVIAREWGVPLLKLDAGRLFDKYVGETEKNFHRAMRLAETMAPVVLWIDEIEKGFASSGPGESDGGLSKRLFGTFLTWLSEKRQEVFVVATANDLSAMPPELLRKGRFDEIFFVDLPTEEERRQIFEIHLRGHQQEPATLGLDRLVAESEGFSGAEIEQVVVSALYRALHLREPLSTELISSAIEETIPLSVARKEDIERLRELARGRFVPVR